MQAQARPPPAERFVPPTGPAIPSQAMQNLIPRLATAINDIDSLKNQIAAGNMDGSMPSWDTLLQRYSMLLGRVQQLSAYIAQEAKTVTGPGGRPLVPPGGTGGGAAAGAGAAGAVTARPLPGQPPAPVPAPGGQGVIERSAPPPALAHYVVHALRPLPPDAGAVAQDVLFQMINTMPLPQLDEAQKQLLADSAPNSTVLSLPGQVKLRPLDELRKLDDVSLARLTSDMRARLKREKARAEVMVAEIQRREDEFDWAFRITEDDEDEEKDDLFDEDEEDGDVKMKEEEKTEGKADEAPNPRQGWKTADYLRFLDTGKVPGQPSVAGSMSPTASTATSQA